MEEIIDETRDLVAKGVKEFNVIAQDLSAYGKDRYGTLMLPELVKRMSDVPGVEWIRLHYAYPTDFPWELTKVMRERENVCSYLDIALQHISTTVLTNMRRHIDSAQTYDLIARLRAGHPTAHYPHDRLPRRGREGVRRAARVHGARTLRPPRRLRVLRGG